MNIFNRLLEVSLVPNIPIPILAMPHTPGNANLPIGVFHVANPASRKFLPRRHNLGHSPSIHRLEKRMHMIGHHHPSHHPVTHRIKAEQRPLHHFRNRRHPEHAGTVPSINPTLHAFSPFHIPFLSGKFLQLRLQSSQHAFRQAVRQMKRHVLNLLRALKVRQIAPTVPSGSIPGSAILLNGAFTPANREIGVPCLRAVH